MKSKSTGRAGNEAWWDAGWVGGYVNLGPCMDNWL